MDTRSKNMKSKESQTQAKCGRKRKKMGKKNRHTFIKTDRQIHREKDNTLAGKPVGSQYMGGVFHCDTRINTCLHLETIT